MTQIFCQKKEMEQREKYNLANIFTACGKIN